MKNDEYLSKCITKHVNEELQSNIPWKYLVTVWKSTVKRDHAQKISSNQFFSNFFSKNIDLTEKS